MFTRQQIRALLAGFICMLIYGSTYTYATIIPYATSYLYSKGVMDISQEQMGSILPISYVVLSFGMLFPNVKVLQFSNKITTAISIVGISLSVFIMSFAEELWLYIVVYGVLFGLFMGFGYIAPIKNCYEHIPKLKGLCSGVCILGLGISSLVFNFILLSIINPDNIQTYPLDDGRLMYPSSVAQNVPKALMIMSAIYLVIGSVGIAFIQSVKEGNSPNEEKSLINSQNIIINGQIPKSLSIPYLIKKKIHYSFLTVFLSAPFGLFIAFNYKQFGMVRINDDAFLTIVGSVGALFNGIGRILFGFLFDRFSYKVISSAINIGLFIFSILIPYLLEEEWMFMIGISLIYFFYGANYSIYPTQTVRLLGQQLGSKAYFMIFFGFTAASIVQYVLRILFVSDEDPMQGYKIIFYIFAGFNLLSLALSILVQYDYCEQILNKKTEKDEIQNNNGQ